MYIYPIDSFMNTKKLALDINHKEERGVREKSFGKNSFLLSHLSVENLVINGIFSVDRTARGDTWRAWLRGTPTSSERITATSWSRWRSYADRRLMPRQKSPATP